MHEQMRRVAAVGVAGLVGLSMAIFDPMAGPAAAAISDIGPISVPSSALPLGGTAAARAASAWSMSEAGLVATGEQAVAAGVANPGWQLAAKVGTGATKVVGAVSGPFTVGATGFFIGFEGANSVMRAMGVKDVGIGALFPPALDPGYLPNADVVMGQPGWLAGVNSFPSRQVTGDSWAVGPAVTLVGNVSGPAVGSAGQLVVRVAPNAPLASGYYYVYVSAAGAAASLAGRAVISGGFATVINVAVPATQGNYAVTLRGVDATGAWLPVAATWYPVGNPLRPPDPIADPARVWETRWTCTGSPSTLTSRSASFKESTSPLPQYPTASCGPSLAVTSMSVWEVATEGGNPPVQVTSWAPSPGQTAWQGAFPQCTTGACTLELYRVDPTAPAGSAKVSCFGTPGACVNWWQDPARADNYRCVYGGTAVAISECAAYAPTFNIKTGTDVQTDLGPVPASGIEPYADPSTGTPVPGSPGQPAQSTTGQPDGCPPDFGFSLGGIGYWVTKGVGCALGAAFVPDGGIDTGPIDNAFTGSPLHQIGTLFGGIGTAFGNMGSGQCGVIVDTYPAPLQGQRLYISTCDPPWDQVGPLRLLITAGFMIGAVVSGIKVLLGTLRINVHSEPTRLT